MNARVSRTWPRDQGPNPLLWCTSALQSVKLRKSGCSQPSDQVVHGNIKEKDRYVTFTQPHQRQSDRLEIGFEIPMAHSINPHSGCFCAPGSAIDRNTALQCTSVEWHECTCTPHMAPRPQAPNQTRWCTSDPQPANLLNCENQAVVNQVTRMCAKTSNNGCKRTAMSQSINPMSNSKAGSKLVALVQWPTCFALRTWLFMCAHPQLCTGKAAFQGTILEWHECT